MLVATYGILPYGSAAYLGGTAVLPLGVLRSPDPARSATTRLGPDATRSTPTRLGPDPARSATTRLGPDPTRSLPTLD